MKSLLSLFLLLLFPIVVLAEPLSIRILHLNDFHGFVRPTVISGTTQPLGGAARLAAQIERLRAEKPTLLLSAGDMIQGDSWANFSDGASVMELMNLMKFDAMVTGNHEYDYGIDILKQRISQAAFPVLAANVTGLAALQPYTIVNRGGLRIGIIGLVTDDIPQTSHPRNTTGLQFATPLALARELIAELRGRTDLIVLLTHIGHSEDRTLAENLSQGPAARGNLVIIGGHSHTRVEKPVKTGDNYVAQAWEHGKTVGVIDVTMDGGRIVSLDGRLEEITPAAGDGDQKVVQLVKRFDDKVAAEMSRTVGMAAVELQQAGIRHQETNLGNLVADIVRETTGAQAAIINGGSIRAGIRPGLVTMRDIYAVIPFNNFLVSVRMSGRQLRETLEHGVSGVERDEGRFPQVSGLTFFYNPAQPVGSRVGVITVAGEPLREEREYVVATLDFMASGGDGYKAFGAAIRAAGDYTDFGGALHSNRLVYNDPGHWLRDIVVSYLEKAGSLRPKVEGRIVRQQ